MIRHRIDSIESFLREIGAYLYRIDTNALLCASKYS